MPGKLAHGSRPAILWEAGERRSRPERRQSRRCVRSGRRREFEPSRAPGSRSRRRGPGVGHPAGWSRHGEARSGAKWRRRGGRARGAGARAVGGGGASARQRRGVGLIRDVGGVGRGAGPATRRAGWSCESRAGTGPQPSQAEEHAGAQRPGAKMAVATRTQAGGRAGEVGGRAWRRSRCSGGRERPATGGADQRRSRAEESGRRGSWLERRFSRSWSGERRRQRAAKPAVRVAPETAGGEAGRPCCGGAGRPGRWAEPASVGGRVAAAAGSRDAARERRRRARLKTRPEQLVGVETTSRGGN